MLVEGVTGLDDCGSSSFGRDRVAAHGIHLGDDCHTQFGIEFGDGNRGSEACPAASDQQNVMVRNVQWQPISASGEPFP